MLSKEQVQTRIIYFVSEPVLYPGKLFNQAIIVKVVDLHSRTYIMKCLSSFCLSNFTSFFEDIIYIIEMLFPMFTSFADWRKLCLEYFVQEFLNFNITQTATCIVSFQFIQVLIFWQEFCEIFRFAESIQIDSYRVSSI